MGASTGDGVNVGQPTYEEVQRAMEEFRQSWFLTLAVLLLRSNLEVTITSEEIEKAKRVQISKFDNADGSVKFVGEVVNA